MTKRATKRFPTSFAPAVPAPSTLSRYSSTTRTRHISVLLYRLTLEAQKRVAESPLSKREIVRRLGTSAAQLYRLLDQTNYRKSVDQVLALLQVLNCEVDLVVRP